MIRWDLIARHIMALGGAVILSLPFCAQAQEACVTEAGACAMRAPAGEVCRCDTALGSIAGKPGQGAEDAADLLHSPARDSHHTTIQVFLKPADSSIVSKWAEGIDKTRFTVTTGNPTPGLGTDPTNAIIYADDAPAEQVRLIGLALVAAGIQIKSIQHYYPAKSNNFAEIKNVIQVGSSALNRQRNPLTPHQIATAELPMFGDINGDK
jgi:hypothetical protein